MAYEKVESREYKVMLDPTRFDAAADLPTVASALWDDLQDLLPDPSVLSSKGHLWTTSSPRSVTFWDTAEGSLYQKNFVLRCRETDGVGRVTLKKRTPDRVLASHNRIRKGDAEDAGFDLRRKFEEDIKLDDSDRMRSLFSHSLDWRDSPIGIDLCAGETVERAFPGFGRALDVGAWRLRPLGGITVSEHVVQLAKVKIGRDPAELALIAWYPTDCGAPSVVELSYRYGGREKNFDPRVAKAALRVLESLAEFVEWRPPEARKITKTNWIYREAGIAL